MNNSNGGHVIQADNNRSMASIEFRDAFQKYLETLNTIRNITATKPTQMTLIPCKGKKSQPTVELKLIKPYK